MGIKIKNLQTGEFEKFNIPALKGEKGEPGEIEPSEKVDYIGKQHSKLRDTMNANVDYIIKTAIGEFNYLDYEGQHITATNSIEGHARSAILKGQTLVNILEMKKENYTFNNQQNWIVEDSYFKCNGTTSWHTITDKFNDRLKPSTKYLLKFEIVENTLGIDIPFDGYGTNLQSSLTFLTFNANEVGIKSCIVTTVSELNSAKNGLFRSPINLTNGGTLKIRFMAIEYQEGMENWDIPYFEGMQSVKMPVLTTIGKNLFDYSLLLPNGTLSGIDRTVNGDMITLNGTCTSLVDFPFTSSNTNPLIVKKGKFYKLSSHVIGGYVNGSAGKIIGLSAKLVLDDGTIRWVNDTIDLANDNCDGKIFWIRAVVDKDTQFDNYKLTIQLEESSTATPYEPYKSSILSLPEEVVLRSLPNGVCDTFNMRTGVYTQRIGEIVLEGESVPFLTDPISNDGLYQSYYTKNNFIENIKGSSHTLSDKLPTKHPFSWLTPNMECVGSNFNGLNISLKLSTLNVTSEDSGNTKLEKLYSYLQLNPIIVQYELANPIIETVDLSDNHVYSYKGITHYSCSSEEGSLVPTLSVKVPTDTQLTIQEQKATTQTLLIKNMDLQQSIKEVQAMNLAFNTALYNSFNSIREEVEDIKKHVSTNENLEGSF